MADERVGLALSITGGETVIRTMRQALDLKNELEKNKDMSIFDGNKAKKEIIDYTNQIQKLKAELRELERTGQKDTQEYKNKANDIKDMEAALRAARVAAGNAAKEVQIIGTGIKATNEEIEAMVRGFEAVGNSISKLGDFSGFIGNMSASLGDAFSSMADLFQRNFIDIVGVKLTAMLTEAFVGHGADVMARADILNTFTDYMDVAGVSQQVAQEALDKVDQSIRGLPIGLDEAAQRLRRYQMFLGDTERATNITIGLQKAITAGGANEQMKRMAYYQVDRLLSAGELATQRQWYSLINGLGVSMRFLVDAMEVGDITVNELSAGLADGTYSAEQLLDAFERLGSGASASAEGLDRALGIYKSTLDSWWRNIQFAMTRGATNMLNALDSALEEGTGTTVVGYMEKIRDAMNDMYKSISAWITRNPDLFSNIIESISNLVRTINGVNFGSFGAALLTNIARLVDMITSAIGQLDTGMLAEFVAFATTLAGPLGKVFTALSSGLPILIGVFERFKDFDFESLINSLIRMAGALSKTVEAILRIVPDSVLGPLMAFGLVWGKPLATVLHTVGGAISALGGSLLGIGNTLTYFVTGLKALGGLLTSPLALGIGVFAASILAVGHAVDYANKKQEEWQANSERLLKTGGTSQLIENSARLRETNEANVESAQAAVDKLALQEKQADSLIAKIRELNAETNISTSDYGQLQAAVAQLNAIYPDWNLSLDETTRHLNEQSAAAIDNASALKAAAKVQAEQALLQAKTESLVAAQYERDKLAQERRDLMSRYSMNGVRTNGFGRSYRDILDSFIQEQGYMPEPGRYADLNEFSSYLDIHGFETTVRATDYDYLNQFLTTEKEYRESVAGLDTEIGLLDEEINKYRADTDLLADSIASTTSAASEQSSAFDGIASQIVMTGEEVQSLKEAYDELKAAAEESLMSQYAGWEELADAQSMSLDEMQKNIDARNEAITNYGQNLDDVKEFVKESGLEAPEGFWEDIFAGEYGDATMLMNSLAQGLKEGDTTAVENVIKGLIEQSVNAGIAAAKQAGFETSQVFGDDALNELAREGIKGITNAAIEALEDAEDPIAEAAIRAGAAANIGAVIEQYKPDAQTTAEALAQAVADGIISREDAIVLAARHAGAAAAQALKEALSNVSVDAYVNVNPVIQVGPAGSVSIRGDQSYRQRLYKSTGGLVPLYASNGQFVTWTPKGTDTVPAMLTPGEFVHNTKAVSTFGRDFMEKVNALNIPGAFESLIRRFSMPNMGSYVTHNQYSRDNHAVVNQNIITNNQNYSQRVARRFVYGL